MCPHSHKKNPPFGHPFLCSVIVPPPFNVWGNLFSLGLGGRNLVILKTWLMVDKCFPRLSQQQPQWISQELGVFLKEVRIWKNHL